ncbi:hypothetical protein AHML_09405 [Aeromonas hydrophila ML09-119]|nr:hypothetical protein AHML_09405 [Aeromonas hydrophila ML09-119]
MASGSPTRDSDMKRFKIQKILLCYIMSIDNLALQMTGSPVDILAENFSHITQHKFITNQPNNLFRINSW